MFSRISRRFCSNISPKLSSEELNSIRNSIAQELKDEQIRKANKAFDWLQLGCTCLVAGLAVYGGLSILNDRTLSRRRDIEYGK